MQNRLCPLCEEKNPENIKFFWDSYQKLFKCKKCNFIFRARFKDFYEIPDYSAYEEPTGTQLQGYLNSFSKKKNYYNYIIEKILEIKKTKDLKILEIGSSEGTFLKLLKNRGMNYLIGVEPQKHLVELAKKLNNLYDIELISDYYSANLFKQRNFDVIFHYHVIEHVEYPRDFFYDNYKHLKDGGIMIFQLPTAFTHSFILDYLLKNSKKSRMILPEHFNYFNIKSLNYILKEIGFKILLMETSNHFYKRQKYKIFWNYFIDPIFNFLKFGDLLVFVRK